MVDSRATVLTAGVTSVMSYYFLPLGRSVMLAGLSVFDPSDVPHNEEMSRRSAPAEV